MRVAGGGFPTSQWTKTSDGSTASADWVAGGERPSTSIRHRFTSPGFGCDPGKPGTPSPDDHDPPDSRLAQRSGLMLVAAATPMMFAPY